MEMWSLLLLCLLAGVHSAPAGGPMQSWYTPAVPITPQHAQHLLHHQPLPQLAALSPARVEPFPLNATRLTSDSVFSDAQKLNSEYLHTLDLDRLLYQFRSFAGLSTGSVQPYGGWESPTYVHGLINGHFTGHLLSALAFDAASTGSSVTAAKGRLLVAELAKCQAAVGTGWLSAYGLDHLERLEAHNTTQVWAPYYTLHKIMAVAAVAGLLDQYEQQANQQAFEILQQMATYLHGRISQLKAEQGEAWWEDCLNTEFGEVGYNLFAITGLSQHKDLGDWFYKAVFMDPLADGRDSLNGNHANCHLPEVVGVARGWEVSGNDTLARITENFHEILGDHYSYATGGSNVVSHSSATQVATSFDADGHPKNSNGFHTEETCTQYNSLKVLRHLFLWSPSASIADDYEIKLINGILGVQQPGVVGSLSYMTPLGRGVNRNQWDWWGFGSANNSFWCCYGSTIESFAKLSDSVYFKSRNGNPPTLWVSQFIPSSVEWADAGGMLLTQATQLQTLETGAVLHVNITMSNVDPAANSGAIKIRVPAWAAKGSSFVVLRQGNVIDTIDVSSESGTFLDVPTPTLADVSGWVSGDLICASFAMVPRLKLINDKRPEYANVGAIMIGPMVFGGLTDEDNSIQADHVDVRNWVVPSPKGGSSGLHFVAMSRHRNYTLVPLNQLVLENYTVYFNITGKSL